LAAAFFTALLADKADFLAALGLGDTAFRLGETAFFLGAALRLGEAAFLFFGEAAFFLGETFCLRAATVATAGVTADMTSKLSKMLAILRVALRFLAALAFLGVSRLGEALFLEAFLAAAFFVGAAFLGEEREAARDMAIMASAAGIISSGTINVTISWGFLAAAFLPRFGEALFDGDFRFSDAFLWAALRLGEAFFLVGEALRLGEAFLAGAGLGDAATMAAGIRPGASSAPEREKRLRALFGCIKSPSTTPFSSSFWTLPGLAAAGRLGVPKWLLM
jgi:hypothetical protein